MLESGIQCIIGLVSSIYFQLFFLKQSKFGYLVCLYFPPFYILSISIFKVLLLVFKTMFVYYFDVF